MTNFIAGSVLTAANLNTAFNTQTIATATSNYTLGSANAGELVLLNSASAGTVTIPLDATYSFATGSVIELYNAGAGTWTVATAGTASTVTGPATTIPQYYSGRLLKTAASTWFLQTDGAGSNSAGLVPITPTSIANSGGSASFTGAAVTFTSVTSLSLNGVFTSTYENYVINAVVTPSIQNVPFLRLRTAGTDNSAASYRWGNWYMSSSAGQFDAGGAAATSASFGYLDYAKTYFVMNIGSPALAANTNFTYLASGDNGRWAFANHAVASAFDGFTYTAASGTLSGTLRVYGYHN